VLDDQNLREIDLSTIDIRLLTAAEWEAVKREVVRRARVERATAMRQFLKRLVRLRWPLVSLRRDRAKWTRVSAAAADDRATADGRAVGTRSVTEDAVSSYVAGDGVRTKGCDPCR